jgi:hypothetical protein
MHVSFDIHTCGHECDVGSRDPKGHPASVMESDGTCKCFAFQTTYLMSYI